MFSYSSNTGTPWKNIQFKRDLKYAFSLAFLVSYFMCTSCTVSYRVKPGHPKIPWSVNGAPKIPWCVNRAPNKVRQPYNNPVYCDRYAGSFHEVRTLSMSHIGWNKETRSLCSVNISFIRSISLHLHRALGRNVTRVSRYGTSFRRSCLSCQSKDERVGTGSRTTSLQYHDSAYLLRWLLR